MTVYFKKKFSQIWVPTNKNLILISAVALAASDWHAVIRFPGRFNLCLQHDGGNPQKQWIAPLCSSNSQLSPYALMNESSICCWADVSSENNFSLQYVDLSVTQRNTVSTRHLGDPKGQKACSVNLLIISGRWKWPPPSVKQLKSMLELFDQQRQLQKSFLEPISRAGNNAVMWRTRTMITNTHSQDLQKDSFH